MQHGDESRLFARWLVEGNIPMLREHKHLMLALARPVAEVNSQTSFLCRPLAL